MLQSKKFFGLVKGSILLILLSITGCSNNNLPDLDSVPNESITSTITPVITNKPMIEPVRISYIEVNNDSSYQDFFKNNPYSQLSKYIKEVYSPDKVLYNYLFRAASNHEDSVDISQFNLSKETIMNTTSSLYEQCGYQLYYLSRVKWSSDYKRINFIYKEDSQEEIKKNLDVFYAQMNHLLYNVAPSTLTPIQRLFAVYDYITNHANYADDFNDISPYNVLVNGEGICGDYSSLAYYILNFVGVPTEYVSNEPHAWNIVTIDGKKYHSDFTWGAGNTINDNSFINTILMSDNVRMAGLESSGFADYPIILGYPRLNPVAPEPITDTRFDFYQYFYNEYEVDPVNNWIYYSDSEGVHRMHLDGSGQENITKEFAYQLFLYHGGIYYNTNSGLYQYKSGQKPVLLSSEPTYDYLTLKDGILRYGSGMDAKEGYELNLNSSSKDQRSHLDDYKMESINLSNRETFQVEIHFTGKMDTLMLPEDSITLIASDGEVIPIYMTWKDEGKLLTVRTRSYINDKQNVTLYVEPGILDYNGQMTEDKKAVEILFTE